MSFYSYSYMWCYNHIEVISPISNG